MSVVYQIVKSLFYFILHIFFSDIEVVGEENIPNDGPVIFVGNHQNQFVDPVMLFTHNKREIGFIIAAKSLTKFIVGFFAQLMKSIPVRRPQDEARNGKGQVISLFKEDGKYILKGKDTKWTQDLQKLESISIKELGDSVPQILEILSDTELHVKFPFDKPLEKPTYSYKIFPHLDQESLYNKVWDTLDNNGCIGIFPEGGSHDRVSLLPLKAGVTIMALGALDRNPKLNLKIVPCGMTYFSGHRFRSHVLLEYGAPITISEPLVEKYKIDKKGACSELLTLITTRLHQVTINYPDLDSMQVIQTAKRLYRPIGKELTPEEYLSLSRRFVEGYIKMKDEKVIKELSKEIHDYNAELAKYGLKDYQSHVLQMDPFEFGWRIVFLILMLIMSLPGFILNGPIAGIAKYLGQKEAKKALAGSNVKVEGKDVIASYKIIIGFVLVPLAYLIYSLIVSYYYGFKMGFLFFCILPFFSYASIRMMEQEVLLYKTCIPVLYGMIKSDLKYELRKIQEHRRDLAEKVRQLVEKFGPQFPFFKERIIKEEDFENDDFLNALGMAKPQRGFKK